VAANMTDFHLGEVFDGAVCPINTLLHLTPSDLHRHLEAMAQHLRLGAHYLVQVGLVDPEENEPFAGSHWEAARGDTRLRIDWVDEELDFVRGRSIQRSRIEVTSGPRVGEIVEEIHEMTLWMPETWREAVALAPFDEVATYDGSHQDEWPRVAINATGGLLWHDLVCAHEGHAADAGFAGVGRYGYGDVYGEGRNRTGDPTVFSRVLYLLSYLARGRQSSRGRPGLSPTPGARRACPRTRLSAAPRRRRLPSPLRAASDTDRPSARSRTCSDGRVADAQPP
jgi:hypothetical protein